MRLFVHHRTHYAFSEPQARLVQLLRLTPRSYEGQSIVSWRIDACRDARLKRSHDGYGNHVTMLYVDGPLTDLTLTVSGEVITDDRAGMVRGAPDPLPPLYFRQPTALTAASPEIAAFAEEAVGGAGSALDRAHGLRSALHERLALVSDPTAADSGAAAAFAAGEALASDMAHCLIAAAHSLGLPARYVAGHRYDADAPEETRHAAHGWAEIHVEGYGWIGFDAAYDICPNEAYVRVATGLDHREAAPVSGQRVGGGAEHLAVDVRVGPDAAAVRQDQ